MPPPIKKPKFEIVIISYHDDSMDSDYPRLKKVWMQSYEVSGTNNMEKQGLIQCLDTAATSRLHVKPLVLDRHLQIMKYLRKWMPATEHAFDVWHAVKVCAIAF